MPHDIYTVIESINKFAISLEFTYRYIGRTLLRQGRKAKQRGAESTAAELERQIAREGEKQKQARIEMAKRDALQAAKAADAQAQQTTGVLDHFWINFTLLILYYLIFRDV